jgi:thiol reductant ABC exporter CydD subunit
MSALDRRLTERSSAVRASVLVTAGLGLLTALLLVAQAWLIASVVAAAVDSHDPPHALRGALLLLLLVILARAMTAWSIEVSAERAAATVTSDLRRTFLAHVVQLGPAWLGSRRSAEVETLATRGLDPLDTYVGRYLPQVVLAVVVPVIVIVAVGARDRVAAAIILLTLPLVPVFMAVVGAHTKARSEKRLAALQGLAGQFLDNVAGMSTLKLFGASSGLSRVRTAAEDLRRETLGTLRLAFLSSLVLELATSLSVAVVAVAVGLRLVDGSMAFRTGLYVLILTPEAYQPLRALAAHYHDSADGVAAAKQVFSVLETPVPDRHRPGAPVDLSVDELRLDGVTMRFGGRDVPALRDLSLTVRPGEVVALTGPSGSGKSTALGLLLGLLRPESGHVRVGARDLDELDLDGWRSLIAWVPQRPYLLARTLAENVRLGRPDAGPDQVAHAVQAAGLVDVVRRLPAGLDTHLGAGGHGLSAGERQRVALARAFLRDAPLVLLDEPTSNLDGETEDLVLASVRRLAAGRTVVLAAHRYSLLDVSDRVVDLGASLSGRTR